MKTKICYNLEGLHKLIVVGGHWFQVIKTRENSEDWGKESNKCYFALPEVDHIYIWHGTFSSTMTINLKNGDKIEAHSKNVTINGNDNLVRIECNKYISPSLHVNGNWVEATNELRNWLNVYYPNITDDTLNGLSQKFVVYDVIEYTRVSNPEKWESGWSYSSKPLVLDEREIEIVLNSIDDELLRKKIECILYARVFRKM